MPEPRLQTNLPSVQKLRAATSPPGVPPFRVGIVIGPGFIPMDMVGIQTVFGLMPESLIGVISQTLCKTKDGSGRIAAHEIMLGTAAIRNLIREAKIAQMYSSIQTGNAMGMQTLDQNLADLVRRNLVSPAEARGKAKFPENFPG